MKRVLVRTTFFRRCLERLKSSPPAVAKAVIRTLELLGSDPYHPRLRTHKLGGEFEGQWSCRAGYDLRIVFKLERKGDEEEILLLSLGTHDEVY